MLKEIYEQPWVLENTLGGRLREEEGTVELGLALDPREVDRVHVIACGTASYAGLYGKYLLETLARLPTEWDVASEYRYRDPVVDSEDPRPRHQPVGGDHRHPGGPEGGQAQGGPLPRGHQRQGEHPDAGGGGRPLHPRRAGDRGGLHQGLHGHARGHGPPRRLVRPGPGRPRPRGGPTPPPGDAPPPQARGGGLGEKAPRGPRGREVPPGPGLPLPGAARPGPHRLRGGAEAQGDQLHPRRGLPRRGDEARAHRPH